MLYLSYLPPIFSKIRDFVRLGEVLDAFFEKASEDIDFVRSGIFISYATGEMLARHERLYDVKSEDGASDTVRRAALKSRLILPETAHGLLFPDFADAVTVNASACTYSVSLPSGSEDAVDTINETADLALPANLERVIMTS